MFGIGGSALEGSDTISKNQTGFNSKKFGLCDKINVLFLGTGAADWPRDKYPSDVNEFLRGNYRGLSSILINKQVLVDCGPTVPMAIEKFDVDVDSITDILITHTHGDHFSLDSLSYVIKNRSSNEKVNIWLEENATPKTKDLQGYNVCSVNVKNSFNVPGFEVIPLSANHKVEGSAEKPLHYLFKAKNKTFFYSLDGAWLKTETWRVIKEKKLDAIIWDATIGDIEGDYRVFEHNSLDMIRCMHKTLRSNGVVNNNSKILLSHMARTLHVHHSELRNKLLPDKMIPAHDGMELSF